MTADIEETVCTSVKESEMFALQVDESTDIGGMTQLLVFIRYIHDDKIVDPFFYFFFLRNLSKQQAMIFSLH